LAIGHIESLEFLEMARPLGIHTIYDVGANAGTWTLLSKSVIPGATVEAFEPLPAQCAMFVKTLEGIDGVRLHTVALGCENGSAALRVMDLPDASSVLRPTAAGRAEFGFSEIGRVVVESRKMDDYRREHDLKPPDLIKLDVQGYELAILRGAAECLRHTKALVVEVSFAEYYEGQSMFHELAGYLATFGLLVAAFGEHTPAGVALKQTDVLFLRRSH